MTVKAESADGKFCCLIYSGENYYIRIYDSLNHTHRDYDIQHSDLWFKIKDGDAYLYTDGDRHWIDHSPETLGIEDETSMEK